MKLVFPSRVVELIKNFISFNDANYLQMKRGILANHSHLYLLSQKLISIFIIPIELVHQCSINVG